MEGIRGSSRRAAMRDEQIVDELAPTPGDTIIPGLTCDTCVESTIRDGFFLDYRPILVADATNPNVPGPTYEATLWNVENLFGWVTTTDDVIGALLRG